MRRHVKAWARPVAAALLAASALPAMPAAAATAPKPEVSAPLSAAIARAAATAPSTALAQASTPAPATADTAGGFFSTTKGKIVVALFAGGVGWTIYSTKNDRDPVKSPIR